MRVVQSASRSSDLAKSKSGVSIKDSVGVGTVRSDLSFDISSIYRLRIQRGRCLFVSTNHGRYHGLADPFNLPPRCVAFVCFDPCTIRHNRSFAVTFADTAETSGRALSRDVLEFPAKL